MDNIGVTIEGKGPNLNISISSFVTKKRFTLKHLKDFGFGRVGLEGVIQGEVNIFFSDDTLNKCQSRPRLDRGARIQNFGVFSTSRFTPLALSSVDDPD